MGNNPVFAVTGQFTFGLPRYTFDSQNRTVFFIVFRECLETTVVVSVLLAFLKQSLGPGSGGGSKTYNSLRKQVRVMGLCQG